MSNDIQQLRDERDQAIRDRELYKTSLAEVRNEFARWKDREAPTPPNRRFVAGFAAGVLFCTAIVMLVLTPS